MTLFMLRSTLKIMAIPSKEKLAIMGRSNGGLLVGAVMTQKPEIAQVALSWRRCIRYAQIS